ncbi:hypothetical protein R5R35_010503 [Gryllus longicercus]|uniref:arginine kinase n=1 Tax=Gryllus longicercus TaxID=2509291 RepID=A0AAN9VHZ4_9ORTH
MLLGGEAFMGLRPARHACHCDAARVDAQALEALEAGFQRLRLAPAATPLRKHLTRRVFALLRYRVTPLGASLWDAVRVGLNHHDARVGALAPDQFAYDAFAVLLDPLLDERHFGFDLADAHPPDDWGYRRLKRLAPLDPKARFVLSTRVRCARNLDGYRFAPTMSADELREVERVCVELLYRLPWEYSGKYLPLTCIPPYLRDKLSRDHCFFDPPDKYDATGNVRAHWPAGRGVYVNHEHSFCVLLNDKDHIRVVALEAGERLAEAFRRVACATPVLDRRLVPACHDRLGYLTVCPGDVGTGLRVSVLLRVSPAVPRHALAYVARVYHLEIRYLDNEPDVACVSNLKTLGCTQYDVLKDFHHGLRELIMVVQFHTPKPERIRLRKEERAAERGEVYVASEEEEEGEEEEEREEEEEEEGEGVCPPVPEPEPEEPGRAYELIQRLPRRQRQLIREANRRRVARERLRKRAAAGGRDWPPAKERLFAGGGRRRASLERRDATGDAKQERRARQPRRAINDRRCLDSPLIDGDLPPEAPPTPRSRSAKDKKKKKNKKQPRK